MMSKMTCFGVLAGCVLATGALYATAPTYSETFDSSSSWTGGELKGTNYEFNATAGLPLSGNALPAGNQVLVIEGNASCSQTVTGSPLVDMMVQTARPDDELGFPSSETTSDIQIAVAVDSNGCFNAYCKNKAGTNVGWYKLSDTQYSATGWARVSFLFDYTNDRCQIRIDGQPIMSANGFITADAAASDTRNGAWYNLAKGDASSVTSMKVIGCTAIDEVAMYADSATYPLVGVSDSSGVSYAWYDQYGLAWTPGVTAPDGSGMTVAEKYNSCLSPLDGQTFAIKSVTTTASKAVVEIPATVANDGRKVVLDSGADPTFASGVTTQAVSDNATTVEVDLPAAGAVKYFRLRATDK